MANGDILSDFGINLLEEEIDDVIFQTNEFLTDATFTGAQGPFWWILQMCMALPLKADDRRIATTSSPFFFACSNSSRKAWGDGWEVWM